MLTLSRSSNMIELDPQAPDPVPAALAPLNIPLVKLPLYLEGNRELERWQAVWREDTQQVLSVVGTGYKLLTHLEAFQGLLGGLHQAGWKFRRVHLERGGAHAHVEAYLPTLNLLEGTSERVYPRLIANHGVDLRSSLKGTLAAYREVCSNGLAVPDGRFSALSFRVVHVGPMLERFEQVKLELGARLELLQKLSGRYRGMLNTTVELPTAEKVLRGLVGKRHHEQLLELWSRQMDAEHTPPTQWTFYQAITWWLTHEAAGGLYYRDLKAAKALTLILGSGRRPSGN